MSANPVSMCDRCAATPDFGRAINIRIQKAGGTCLCARKFSEDNDTSAQPQPCFSRITQWGRPQENPAGGESLMREASHFPPDRFPLIGGVVDKCRSNEKRIIRRGRDVSASLSAGYLHWFDLLRKTCLCMG